MAEGGCSGGYDLLIELKEIENVILSDLEL
jgi:hypothetical protein